MLRYHCACCNRVVAAQVQTCPECGSHHITSPFGFWIFCVGICLALAIGLQAVHMYSQQEQHSLPEQQRLFEVLTTADQNKN